METETQTIEQEVHLDDHLISLFGGLVFGSTAWAIAFAFVAFIKAAAAKGINVLDVLSSAKLVPPPGIDLSNINISITLPESQIVDIVFITTPILFGLVIAWISYRKVLNLE